MNPTTGSPAPAPLVTPEAPTQLTTRQVDAATSQLRLVRRLPGVVGTLLATVDGRSVVSDVTEPTPGSAAAVTASSLALASRLGDLTGDGTPVEELQVRSKAGYVCLYVIDADVLLAVVTDHAVNLARLKLETRSVIDALRRTFTPQSSSTATERGTEDHAQ